MKLYFFILLLLITACTSPYHEHFFRENPEFWDVNHMVSGEIFQSTGNIESLPNKNTQKDLITSIDNAQKRIWIEIYTWTDAASLTESIIRAKKRWLDIQVVVEGNVFWTPKINLPVVKKLKNEWILVSYADNNRYSFTHAKFWIIDDRYSISTGNWTASFFTKNREYIYTGDDKGTLTFLQEIFLADFSHMGYKSITDIPSHIVISPLDARMKIEKLIRSTQKDITLYIQTLDDEHILSLIGQLYSEKKNIQICTADNETNRARMWEFPLWHWKVINKPYLHAKIIIVDHSQIFIGSHNLTTNAIENNREMWILLNHRDDIVNSIRNNFISDGCD